MYRKTAYWDDVMVGHTHWISSLTKEGAVLELVKHSVPGIKAVHVPMSGAGCRMSTSRYARPWRDRARPRRWRRSAASSISSMPSCLTRTWTYSTSAKCFWPWQLASRRIAARSQRARAQRNGQGRLRLHQAGGQTVCRTAGDLGRSAVAHRSAENYRRETMGTDPGRTLGIGEAKHG